MLWQSYLPGHIYFGTNIIKENNNILQGLGSKALIVTGQGGSARRIGALDDICQALQHQHINWEIFDQVEANPSIDTARAGARLARACGADFIIGIGGGSPLDAAKAIAILARNDISEEALLNGQYGEVLPLAAVATTAGTGSEITPYSILTFPAHKTKRSITSPKIIPRLAILDPRYTSELPWQITADTAVDAYSHALESYLSVKTTPLSEVYAHAALKILGAELKLLSHSKTVTMASREALLFGSMLGGMAISTTGTSIPHALGYPFTFYKDVPHGRANGLIMTAYLDYNLHHSADPKTSQALEISGFEDLQHFQRLMETLCGPAPVCSQSEKETFIEQTMQAKNLVNNLITPSRQDLIEILEKTLQ